MIYSLVHSKELLTHTPHETEFAQWKTRLTAAELTEIARAIGSEIDLVSDVRTTPTYKPTPNWTKVAYQPILRSACLGDEKTAQRCFAIFAWEILKRRDEGWTVQRQHGAETAVEDLRYYMA